MPLILEKKLKGAFAVGRKLFERHVALEVMALRRNAEMEADNARCRAASLSAREQEWLEREAALHEADPDEQDFLLGEAFRQKHDRP